MQLGRLGVWYSADKMDGPGLARFVRSVEALGYDTLWYPESRGFESLSIAGFMLGNTTKLKIGSSIASIYARDAFTARRGFITLRDLYGDRFILGLGVSHVPMVEGLRGHVYEKPVPPAPTWRRRHHRHGAPGRSARSGRVFGRAPPPGRFGAQWAHAPGAGDDAGRQMAGGGAEGHH